MKIIKYIFHITGLLVGAFIGLGFIDLILYLDYDHGIFYLIKSILYFVLATFFGILNYKTGGKL